MDVLRRFFGWGRGGGDAHQPSRTTTTVPRAQKETEDAELQEQKLQEVAREKKLPQEKQEVVRQKLESEVQVQQNERVSHQEVERLESEKKSEQGNQELKRKNEEFGEQSQKFEWEKKLEQERQEVERQMQSLKKEKEKLEQEKQEVARKKAELEEQMRQHKRVLSASYQSRIENRDVTLGQGSTTHEDISRNFDMFVKKAPREFRQKLKIAKDDLKGDPKQLMCTLFQEVYDQSKLLVLDILLEELQRVLKCADGGGETEILWQRRRAYSILLHTAGEQLPTSKQQAEMKAIQALQAKSEIFRQLYSTAPEVVGSFVKKAADISWNMVTTSPPCIVWQPPTYDENWHNKLSSKWNIKKGQSGVLVYYEPVLFYDASGMVGRKGLVGSECAAPGEGRVFDDYDVDEESESENNTEPPTAPLQSQESNGTLC